MNRPDSQDTPLWTRTGSEANRTGSWRAALPVYLDRPSPCMAACPVSGRIADWIGLLEAGDPRGAWRSLVENNPFPAIAGRICHHPCEAACNRAQWDETVSICALERHLGDAALAAGWSLERPARERARSVAVLGGGPAGLSAAYQLRRAGLRVTLYEARAILGGLMASAIPAYRLERSVLEAEIARILDLGIRVRLGVGQIDRAGAEALLARHEAVFLATGASLPRRLAGLDYQAGFVIDSADFLAAPPARQAAMTGAHVLVIGGGSAAMDVARSARRRGRRVTVLALEPEHLLAAQASEVEQAREEGVELIAGARLEAVARAGDGLALRCVRVAFCPGSGPGGFRAEPIADSGFALRADTIVPAIGQDADLARWRGWLDADGPVLRADPETGATGRAGVFAGGDLTSSRRFVTEAIGMGGRAGRAIAARLLADIPADSPAEPPPAAAALAPLSGPPVGFERINTVCHKPAPRARSAPVDVARRLAEGGEVDRPLPEEAARREAERCFSCGRCTGCDRCFFFCPDMAIARLDPGYAVRLDYCKGCGLCVAECPTGAVQMVAEARP